MLDQAGPQLGVVVKMNNFGLSLWGLDAESKAQLYTLCGDSSGILMLPLVLQLPEWL